MPHPASDRRAKALLASATPCWRKCGVAVIGVDELATALDDAWEAGREFAAQEARRYDHGGADFVYGRIVNAKRPE